MSKRKIVKDGRQDLENRVFALTMNLEAQIRQVGNVQECILATLDRKGLLDDETLAYVGEDLQERAMSLKAAMIRAKATGEPLVRGDVPESPMENFMRRIHQGALRLIAKIGKEDKNAS